MTDMYVFKWILGILSGVVGAAIVGAIRTVMKLPKEYVLKEDHRADLKELKTDMAKRFDRLETGINGIQKDLKEIIKERR